MTNTNTFFPSEYFQNLWDQDDQDEFVNENEFIPIDLKVLEDTPNFGQDQCDPEIPNLLHLFKSSEQTEERSMNESKPDVHSDSLAKVAQNTQSTIAKDTTMKNNVHQQQEDRPKNEELKANTNRGQPEYVVEEDSSVKPTNKKYNSSESESYFQDYSNKKTRWGRNQDKKLFSTLRQMERRGKIDLNMVMSINTCTCYADFPEIRELCRRVGWKRIKKDLVNRIQQLSCSTKMSVRETRLFKKIINNYYNPSNIDFEAILFHFPGKTVEILQRHYESIYE